MTRDTITLDEIATLAGGRVRGDGDRRVRGIAPLRDAGPDQLGLLADARYLEHVPGSRAAALLISSTLEAELEGASGELPRVVVDDPHGALIPILRRLYPEPPPTPGVHPTAVLGTRVVLGGDVTVGPAAVLGDDTVIGDRVRIGAHVVLGEGARVGEETVLHPHVVLYPGTVVGRRCIVHAGARLGVDGFGYAGGEGDFRKVPQVGRCVVEDDVEIGANACLDRGSIGDTVVGAGSKLDNLVHVGHNVRVGEGCAMAAQVGIAGSTRIGPGSVLGGQAGVGGHLEIGPGARVGGQAGVIGDVEAGAELSGFPARDLKTFFRASAVMLRLPQLRRELRALQRTVEGLRNEAGDGDRAGASGAPGSPDDAVEDGAGEAPA